MQFFALALCITKRISEAYADCIGGVSPPSPKGRAEREQRIDHSLVNEMNKIHKVMFAMTLIVVMVAVPMTLRKVAADPGG